MVLVDLLSEPVEGFFHQRAVGVAGRADADAAHALPFQVSQMITEIAASFIHDGHDGELTGVLLGAMDEIRVVVAIVGSVLDKDDPIHPTRLGGGQQLFGGEAGGLHFVRGDPRP